MNYVEQNAAVAPVQLRGDVIPRYKTYAEYKEILDREIKAEAESFVRIGYLLKIARDTNILAESGYADLYQFAQAEYQIDKSRVSRYMNINDRFSKDGYSMELLENYKGFGVAKLAVMLTLPETVTEELSPDFSKSEIVQIHKEIEEERNTTPLEHMLEGESGYAEGESDIFKKALLVLAEDKPEMFREMHRDPRQIKLIMAPSGENMYSIRINGIGRFLLSVKEKEPFINLINERTTQKEARTWEELSRIWDEILDFTKSAEENWEAIFGRKLEPVAPVQQKNKKNKEKNRKKKVEKIQQKSEKNQPEEETRQEEQLPGQMDVGDYPELIPEEELDNNKQDMGDVVEPCILKTDMAAGQIAEDCGLSYPICKQKQTNGDRIRSMSDEELTKIIMCPYDTYGKPEEIMPCVRDGNVQKSVPPEDCKKCMMEWLQSEVDEWDMHWTD